MPATAKYDPTKPVTIDNPLPQDQWPIREGRKVVFISRKWSDFQVINEDNGTIRWYNPAFETTCVTSKGHPTFTINVGKDSADIVSVDHVFPDTKTGRLALQKLKAEMYLAMAENKRKDSKRCLEQAAELEAKSKEIMETLL